MPLRQTNPKRTANHFAALGAKAFAALSLITVHLATAGDAALPNTDQSEVTAKPGCCPATGPEAAGTHDDTARKDACPVDQLAQTWGIEITSLRLSAQGYFVDFRYKVLDSEKAAPLANRDTKPYLIDQATGQRLRVPSTPKLGSLRQTAQQLTAGRIYYIFFGNSRGIVKAGTKVTVVVGDCRIEDLTVE